MVAPQPQIRCFTPRLVDTAAGSGVCAGEYDEKAPYPSVCPMDGAGTPRFLFEAVPKLG
jgi:hypothetical protein